MSDSEDVKKIDEIIRKYKIEAEDSDELEYAEFIDYADNNEADDTVEDEDYEIPEFPKSNFTNFHTYTPTHFLTDEEKGVIDSCSDPDLKQLLLLNRNKNIQLMQLYKKIKDLMEECEHNIAMKEEFISAAQSSRRVCNRIWRLGIPYFKTKDDFPCPRNEDITRKHNNGELLFYEMTPSNKWLEKDMNRLLKGVAFHYKIYKENELERTIRQLEREIKENPDAEKEELLQELKNNLEDIRNSQSDMYPPLNADKLDWHRISQMFLNERYSAQDCQIFWNTYLHPDINKGPWTSEENERLKSLASQYNVQSWDLIASELGNSRTGFIACIHYYNKIDPPRLGRFSAEEDKLLCDLVEQYKQGEYVPWTKIAHHFKERTRAQLFYRYKYFLSCRSGTIRGKFTEAEDILILVLVDRFGKKFTTCGKYFPNRSVVQIKARYSSNLRGAIKKGSFTVEEDQQILDYVKCNGSSSWEPLVQRLNRCGGQIRQRYKTLMAFAKANPGVDIDKAPRRKFNGISFNTEYDFLRCMAERFKNCEKIPTLQDIEKLLLKNPMPQPEPQWHKNKSNLEPRIRTKKEHIYENKNRTVQNTEATDDNREHALSTTENLAENLKNSEENQNKIKARLQTRNPTPKKPKFTVKFPPTSDDSDDDDETFSGLGLTTDNLLIDFFSNSMRLNCEQGAKQVHINKVATAVISALSTLQVELHIPKNFEQDPRLDAVDLDILKILTMNRSVNQDREYVISRTSLSIESLIPPNLNTLVGMRSLLIKNQIYKSKHAKRAHIFENFKSGCKEKQVLWCINNHLSNQSLETREALIMERNLFFRRFVSLFKFPAIMTLQKPSELLESTAKTWKEVFTSGVRTYKKKPRPTVPKGNENIGKFEGVFIKQQPTDQEDECPMPVEQQRESEDDEFIESTNKELLKVRSVDELQPKLSIVEQLKRKICDTIDELCNRPPQKKFYPDSYRTMEIPRRTANKIVISQPSQPAPPITNSNLKVVRKTYAPKHKTKKIVNIKQEAVSIKTENMHDLYPGESRFHESQTSFNLGRGELVLENNSPDSSVNENNSIGQDLQDVRALDAVLKKEQHVVEESFDF